MPVIVKRLLRSFQYLFSHKSIIYAILSSAMLRENYSVFLGGKYRFLRGGGGKILVFDQNIDPCLLFNRVSASRNALSATSSSARARSYPAFAAAISMLHKRQ